MSANNTVAKAKIRIHAPAAQVLSAFTDPEKMSQFWFKRNDSGMVAGQAVTFTLGSGTDAFSFDALVSELDFPSKLVLEWDGQFSRNQVTWLCTEDGDSTLLSIEEIGFKGDDESVALAVLDSTGGFNQVIVAAKAFIEHGVAINVVNDHA